MSPRRAYFFITIISILHFWNETSAADRPIDFTSSNVPSSIHLELSAREFPHDFSALHDSDNISSTHGTDIETDSSHVTGTTDDFQMQHKDSTKKTSIVTARSINPNAYNVTLRAVDISRFPEISVILDATDKDDRFYPYLKKSDLIIFHDAKPRSVLSLEMISSRNNFPVDIVFVIDQTGSMRQSVNGVKMNVEDFTNKLTSKGVDYRLGLVTFTDRVERRRDFTNDVREFIKWIDMIRVGGGGDNNENALEGIYAASQLKFRKNAQRIIIVITDAMFHRLGDNGDGTTTFTTKTISDTLLKSGIRLFAVTPPDTMEYEKIVRATHGQRFKLIDDFSSILDVFTASLTSLYAVKYRLSETTPPEEAMIEIRNSQNEVIFNDKVELLGVDKKFIVENILFDFNKANLSQHVIPELNHILAMLKTYTNIEVEIQGHTDYIGSDEYNVALSQARALSVKQYLSGRGIEEHRITTRGMGKHFPIAPNDTEEGRQLNRRTEIVITKK